MVKLLNALNTYGVLADDNNLDFLVDVLRAIKHVPNPQSAPCADGCGDQKSCVTFYPWHSNFEFAPGVINGGTDNPPPAYGQHPFFTGDRYSIPFFTLQDTDVLCDFTSSWPDRTSVNSLFQQILQSGYPRFRFTFEAQSAGSAFIHMLDVPQGGYALVRLDEIDDINLLLTAGISGDDLTELITVLGQLIDDVFDIQPNSLIPEHIHELKFGPGQHTIDVLFLPRIEFPNVLASGWGGGIRKIVICGEEVVCPDPEADMPRPELRSIPDPTAPGCKIIQWKYETEGPTLWRNLATVCDGATGPAGPAGDCGCPDPATDDRDIPAPTNVPDTCALARRLANHIIDLHTRWANDIAYSLYTQGRAAQDVANDISEFLYAGTLEPYVSAVTGDEYQYDVWNVLFANALILPLIGGNFVSNVVALVNGYQALDVIALRDAVAAARDDITCAWIDALDSDLTVLQGEYDGFKSALAGRMTDASAAAQLQAFLALIPLARIRQLARTVNDVPTYDCIDCAIEYEWCLTFDFTLDRRGWVTGNFPGDPTGYTAGTGLTTWFTTNNVARVTRFTGGSWFIGGLVGTAKAVTVDYENGVRGTGAGDLLLRLSGGDWVQEFPRSGWSGSGRMTAFITPATGRPLNSIQLSCTVSDVQPAQDHIIGNLTITRVTVYGVGPIPAWSEYTEVC